MNCVVDEINNKDELGRFVIEAFKNGQWNIDWCVVDTIVRAESTTVMMANGNRARVELSAPAIIPFLNLADPKLDLSVRYQSGDVTRFIAESGLTPLFKLSSIKQSFLGGIRVFGGDLPNPWETVAPD